MNTPVISVRAQRFNPISVRTVLMALALVAGLLLAPVQAEAAGQRGKVTGKSVAAGVCSLLVWPGIGQAINDNPGKKVATHAIIGLLPPYRLWSGYDALFDRKGGYWEGRI
jgi:hypothetical protein